MKKYVLFLLAILSGFISTSQTLPAYLPSNGLVGWWPFNGNANDESGNGNDGVVNGASLTQDRFGVADKAYYLDGQTSYLSVPVINNSLTPQQITVAVWCKIPSDYTANNGIGMLVRSRFFGYIVLYNNSTQGLRFETYSNGNSTATSSNTNGVDYSDDSWHHVVGTFNGSINSIYVDGILMNTSVSNQSAISYSSDGIIAFGRDGNNSSTSTALYQGDLDDIAIYNRALTQEEITSLYTGEPANPQTACNPLPSNLQNGLVGYWPFCGNANDESGNGNDGTVNGATLTEDRFGAANAAYDFDGIDDKIVSTLETFSGQSMTLSCWYNTSDSQIEIEKALICSRNSYVETNGLFIYYFNGNPNYYFDRSICGGASTIITPIPSINSGNWIHYIGILDNDEMKLYENGQLISTSLNSSPFCINGKFVFGADTTFSNRFFNGTLDDIGIWNRALSPDEVQELYTLNACTFTIYDTVTVNNYVTVYDTVSVSTTDTLIINTLITAVQPAQENTFLVYPNPAHSQITIDNGNWSILGGYSIRIVNSAAQEVYNAAISQQTETIPLNSWGGNGLYVMYIIDPQQQIVAVKQIVLE